MLRKSLYFSNNIRNILSISLRFNSNDYPAINDYPVSNREAGVPVSGIVATVFGATGYSGRYVISRLGEQGSQVVIPYRGTENTFRHLKVLGDLGQIVAMECDVWKQEQLESCCSQSNIVINLIGSKWPTKNFSLDDANHIIPRNIAKAAKNAGVARLIHVSSLGAKKDATNEFGRTKYAGELAVKEEFPSATILRPSTLFGYDDHLLNRWAGIFRYWPFVPLIKEILHSKEAPLAATDFADAVQKCIFDLSTIGKVYELQGPSIISTQELINLVRQTTYLDTREYHVPFKIMRKLASITGRIMRKPRVTADELDFLLSDNLAKPNSLGMSDLQLRNLIDINEHAVKFIRHYRRAKLVNEL